jgi:nuclear transport factor 2 (NTF2) superfamily protein
LRVDTEQRLRALYVAFNAREIDTVLAALHEDVDWPNAWEGGRLRGRAAVRDYWTRQWAEIDGQVEPVEFTTLPDRRVAIEIDQTVRDLNGTLLSEGRVRHVYAFAEDGLVTSMEVE